ncbi:hypothetical protein QYE76_070151 [Lolium multiflorum]|uniref:Uncharacterized protein n=1 Tax=Lolium multiflorum TaxID=4521 RepID=A0AAD8SJ35_LOLMU|nr:hypothetical protein QYE76_070151 [Lolium multiflorum]
MSLLRVMILLCVMMIPLCMSSLLRVKILGRLLLLVRRLRRPPKQKRKLTAAPPTAPKRSSTPMRAQTPELLPHEQTEEQKAFLAPKKMFIKPQTMKHFAETRMKRPELRSDHDRSLGQSYRASKEAKKVAQLGQQDNRP